MVGEVRKEDIVQQVGLEREGPAALARDVPADARALDRRVGAAAQRRRQRGRGPGRLDADGCRDGFVRLTLIVKQPRDDRHPRVNGEEAKRLEFPGAEAGGVLARRVPGQRAQRRPCTLEVAPTGLLGTTVLHFDRG